jgi:hypothetical protein
MFFRTLSLNVTPAGEMAAGTRPNPANFCILARLPAIFYDTEIMALTLSIVDETVSGKPRCAGDFHFDAESLTLRELIYRRVQQEVERFNRSDVEVFQGLVEPEEIERILNGVRERPVLDWEKQVAKALTAFRGNGFLVLVDDRQITDLDQTLHLTAETKVAFLKLVPLVGG